MPGGGRRETRGSVNRTLATLVVACDRRHEGGDRALRKVPALRLHRAADLLRSVHAAHDCVCCGHSYGPRLSDVRPAPADLHVSLRLTRYLYLPGTSTPMPQGGGYTYAPVVQAQPGASEQSLSEAFGDVVGKVATEIGKGAAEAMFGQRG